MAGHAAVAQPQPRRAQRWVPIIGQGAAHGQAIAAHRVRLRVGPPVHLPLDQPHAAHLLLELLLGVAVRLEEGARGFAQIVERAEVVRHAGQHGGDRDADGVLPVRDDARDGDGQRVDGLGLQTEDVLALLPPAWSPIAGRLVAAWDAAVRASSAVENWHSALRPHLAVHRTLPPGLLALLAV